MDLTPVALPFGGVINQLAPGHGVGNDTALLVEQVLKQQPNTPSNVLELGSGSGVLALMLAYYRPDWQLCGIEFFAELVDLANNNAAALKLPATFMQADIKTYTQPGYDIICANPPYYKLGQGKISPNPIRTAARHELHCNLPQVLACCQRNLQPGGKAYLVYPDYRQSELLAQAQKLNGQIVPLAQHNKSTVYCLTFSQ